MGILTFQSKVQTNMSLLRNWVLSYCQNPTFEFNLVFNELHHFIVV